MNNNYLISFQDFNFDKDNEFKNSEYNNLQIDDNISNSRSNKKNLELLKKILDDLLKYNHNSNIFLES